MACKKLLLLAHPLFHLDPCWQNLLEGLCFFVLEILVEGRGGKGEFRRGYRMRLWVCGSNSPGKRRRSEGVLSIRVVVVEGDWVLDCFLMVFWGSCCNSRLGLLFRCWDGPGSLFLLPPPRIPAIGSRIFWALPCGELPLPKAALVGTRKIDHPLAFLAISLLHLSIYLSVTRPCFCTTSFLLRIRVGW